MNEKELQTLVDKAILDNKEILEKRLKEEIKIKNNIEKCIDKYKKLYGLKPYNEYNPCYQDGYFAKSIQENFSEDIRMAALQEVAKLM